MLFQRTQFLVSLGALVVFSASVWAAPARITVLGPDAKPLAKAKVAISERLDYSTLLPTRELLSDANGVVTLELDESQSPRHAYTARVLVPGLAVAGGEIRAGATKFNLQPGQKWGGVVLDAAQKPVAGVKVSLIAWRPEKLESLGQGATLDGNLVFTATTDALGRYGFDNLPLVGRAGIEIHDPRFQGGSYSLDLSQKTAPPLFLRAGGTVTGRAVTPDGKPLVGADIAVFSSGGFLNAKTGADGVFSIGGLKPDADSLRSFSVAGGWVLKALPFEPVKAGETRRMPDWIASRALEVTGQLLDAVSKKPLAGIAVEIQADATQFSKTDAQGRFKTYSSRDVYFLRVRDARHIEKVIQQVSIPAAATSYDFGAITLAPGAQLTGTVRDENGEAPRNFYFTLQNKDQGFSQFVRTEDGLISPVALPPGTFDLVTQDTAIVSPQSLTVAAGKPLSPLKIVAKPAAQTLAARPSVAGRVVNEAGETVAGALVQFKGNPSMGIGVVEAVSGLDGRFSEMLLDGKKPVFLGIVRPGFVLAESAAATQNGAQWQLGDIAVQPSGQVFSGRVLMAGKPVAGARVALSGNNWREPAKTDANGTFSFEDLPRGEMELLAASAEGFTTLKTRGDAKAVTLNLEVVPATDRAALANELIIEQPRRGDWRLGWDVFGADAMEIIALRGDKALDEQNQPIAGKAGYNLAIYFADLAQRDAAQLLARGPQMLPLFRAGAAKAQAETMLARVQAASGEAESQKAATAWLEREKDHPSDNPVANVRHLFGLAEVAARLQQPDSAVLLDRALTFALQLPEKTRRDEADFWGARAARISPAALEMLLQDMDAPAQFTALSAAVRALSRGGDFDRARLDLKKIEELQLAPEIKVADQSERDARGQKFESGALLQRARTELSRSLSLTDAAGALQIAQSIGDDQIISRLNALLSVAQTAHRGGHDEVARAALQQVADASLVSADYSARAAAIAMSFDAPFGAQLFQRSFAKAAPGDGDISNQPSVATWATQNAPFDAALSRVVLEREWSWRLPVYLAAEAAKKDPNEYNPHQGAIGELAQAVSALDAQRALEWAKALPPKSYNYDQTKALIALALSVPPAQRAGFNYGVVWEAPDY